MSEHDIFNRLEEEIARAERYGRYLSIICLLPQRLVVETPRPEEIDLAAEAVRDHLRFSDQIGRLGDGTIVVILPETQGDTARVTAHRMVADLAVRSRAPGWGHAKWLAGVSTVPDDGRDPPTLVTTALHRAED